MKTQLTLRVGHATPFRKTVPVGKGKKKQLTFQPGEVLELSEEEVAGVQRFIDSGLLIDPTQDPKGRFEEDDIDQSESATVLAEQLEGLGAELASAEVTIKDLMAQVKTLKGEKTDLENELAAAVEEIEHLVSCFNPPVDEQTVADVGDDKPAPVTEKTTPVSEKKDAPAKDPAESGNAKGGRKSRGKKS